MAEHIHNTTTSRRRMLTALSGAAIAGGALVVAMPTEAPAITILDPGADAELIALCDQHIANLRAYNYGPSATERGCDDDHDPLWFAYEVTRDAISEAEPQTVDGMVAIARTAMAEAYPDRQDADDRCFHGMDEEWAWRLVGHLLRLHGARGV